MQHFFILIRSIDIDKDNAETTDIFSEMRDYYESKKIITYIWGTDSADGK